MDALVKLSESVVMSVCLGLGVREEDSGGFAKGVWEKQSGSLFLGEAGVGLGELSLQSSILQINVRELLL